MKTRRWVAHVGMVLGIAVFGFATPLHGQGCPEYAGTMDVEMWPSSPSQVQISGSFAYLGGPRYLSITDVTDLERPRVVGRIAIDGEVIDFRVSGDRLSFISESCRRSTKLPRGSCYRNLHITDVSYPERPQLLWMRGDLDFWPRRIAVSGDTFLIASTDGLRVIDVTDGADPVEVGFHASAWEPSDLVFEGGLAYVALPDEGLRIMDVSDPANPVEVGGWSTTWEAWDLEVSDGFAYVADGTNGLRILDVANPTEPTEVGVLIAGHAVVSVSVDGPISAVGLADQGVAFVDVTNQSNPVIVGFYPNQEAKPDVALAGSTAFAIADGFRVLDVSSPSSPNEVSFFNFRSSAMDVVVSNEVTYIANGESGLYVLDESNPGETIKGFLDTPGFALGVALHGDLVLVADDHEGLRIIDVSDSANLVEVGFLDTPGQARRVAAEGDHAYVADGEGGLRIVDISLPESPVEVTSIATPDSAIDVAVHGDLAFVADGYLRVIDVTDPGNPFDDTPEDARESATVEIEDGMLYSAFGDRLEIYSLSGSSVPTLMASTGLMGSARDVTISGQLTFVATQLNDESKSIGVDIIDVLNPCLPTWLGSWGGTGGDPTVAVSDGRVFLASGEPGVKILASRCLTTYWVQIVAHQSGVHDSHWRSDVIVSHQQERGVNIDFILHTMDGEFTAGASVDVGQQGVFEDIVDLLGYEGMGALEIQADLPINIISRAYSETESGTFGTHFLGHRATECLEKESVVHLLGLRQEVGKFRTNISVTNTGKEPGYVVITLYKTDGRELVSYTIEVEPGMAVQDLQPFKHRADEPNVGWGFATVQVGGSSTTMLVSATVIDSRTNDAVMVPVVR